MTDTSVPVTFANFAEIETARMFAAIAASAAVPTGGTTIECPRRSTSRPWISIGSSVSSRSCSSTTPSA
ncbi:MAG: hypothetical protein ACRDVF_12220 [Microbacterium sp.]|uniref:hypothetical protein n=1 Tax=Microbacterium sp. TaxID=51671 RepID=UPI003D6EA731